MIMNQLATQEMDTIRGIEGFLHIRFVNTQLGVSMENECGDPQDAANAIPAQITETHHSINKLMGQQSHDTMNYSVINSDDCICILYRLDLVTLCMLTLSPNADTQRFITHLRMLQTHLKLGMLETKCE